MSLVASLSYFYASLRSNLKVRCNLFHFFYLHVTADIILHDCIHVVDVVRGGAVHVVLLTVQSCFQVRLVLGGTEQRWL